jgi:DNA mismatch repair protein PMS2
VSLLADEPIFEGSNYGTTSISQHEHGDESQEMCLSSIRTFIRPSRVRAMLASRACRSSIMIGHALSKKQMQKVNKSRYFNTSLFGFICPARQEELTIFCKKKLWKVLSHLAELESPWNCPHGRPTMRHLMDLSSIKKATV